VQSLAKQVMGLSKYRKFDTAPAGRFSLADDGFERRLPAISLSCRFWPTFALWAHAAKQPFEVLADLLRKVFSDSPITDRCKPTCSVRCR